MTKIPSGLVVTTRYEHFWLWKLAPIRRFSTFTNSNIMRVNRPEKYAYVLSLGILLGKDKPKSRNLSLVYYSRDSRDSRLNTRASISDTRTRWLLAFHYSHLLVTRTFATRAITSLESYFKIKYFFIFLN